MIRLDIIALKAAMTHSTQMLRHYPDFRNDEKEEVRMDNRFLLDRAIAIIEREEPDAKEAIHFLGVLANFKLQLIYFALPDDNRLCILKRYKLIDVERNTLVGAYASTQVLTRIALLVDVVREKIKDNEEDLLKGCLQILRPNLNMLGDIFFSYMSHFRPTWERALEFPELVKEFKDIGFQVCSRNYENYHLKNFVPEVRRKQDYTVEKRTREVFLEVLGPTDQNTIRLMCFEFQRMLWNKKCTLNELMKMCEQYRPSFEKYIESGGSIVWYNVLWPGGHVELCSLENQIVSLIIRKKWNCQEFLTESLRYCKAIYENECNKEMPNVRTIIDCFIPTVKYQMELNRTREMFDMFSQLRIVIVNTYMIDRRDSMSIENLCDKMFVFMTTLSETAIELSTSKKAKNCNCKMALLEDSLISLGIVYDLCMEPRDEPFIPNFLPELVLQMIGTYEKLGQFDKILSITEMSTTLMINALDKGNNLQYSTRFQEITKFCKIQEKVFKIAVSKNVDQNLKVALLTNSIVAMKDIFALYLRLIVNAGVVRSPLSVLEILFHIVNCYMELKLFSDMESFFKVCALLINSEEMIRLGVFVLERFKPGKKREYDKLLRVIQGTTMKHLKIISCPDYGHRTRLYSTNRELILPALVTIGLCRTKLNRWF